MKTTEISNAHLNVSKHYTVHNIDNFISRLNNGGFNTYYNTETKSIDVEIGNMNIDSAMIVIKEHLKNWINGLPLDFDTSRTIRYNLDFIFNITRINTADGIIIKVYLF